MEKLSVRITKFLLKKQHIEESMYNIYQYGMQMALEIGFSFITSILICCIYRKVIEGVIFFAVFIPLRSYLGGFHMKSYWACYICSCATLVIVLGLSSFESNWYVSWLHLSISIIMVFFEAKRERMRDAEGRHFYPRVCVIILAILIMSIVFTIFGSYSKLFLLACTNILVVVSKWLQRI